MTREHLLPTIIAAIIGLAAVLLVLFAWHLPPFSSSSPMTENAYIRGRVIALAPQQSGYIREVFVNDFGQVAKGEPIAKIDDRIYRQKLTQAEAALEAARAALAVGEQAVVSARAVERSYQASLEAAEAALEVARTRSKRAHALSERGITSTSELDVIDLELSQSETAARQAKAQLEMQDEAIASAVSQLSARQAEIQNAEAAVELARIDLQNTLVTAPEDGRLGQVSARPGQYVTPGTVLVNLVGNDVWVIANFKETELSGMEVGTPVSFTVDALNGSRFKGHVEAFSPATASEFSVLSSSNVTGNFTKIAQRLPVRIAIDAGQQGINLLAPGMSVIAIAGSV